MSVFLLLNYDHHYHPVLYVEWYIFKHQSLGMRNIGSLLSYLGFFEWTN